MQAQATLDASEELLTTGEAAKLLSSTRQHVVNLCNSGDLPFGTVGSELRQLLVRWARSVSSSRSQISLTVG